MIRNGSPSRAYIPDLPPVIEAAKCPEPVNKMEHHFFQPQPITGAWGYYLHSILHDWPDEAARKILLMLRGAMKRGYSKLLVHDHVIPETGVHPHMPASDLSMMVLLAVRERTEAQWKGLLESGGYRLVKVWRTPLVV